MLKQLLLVFVISFSIHMNSQIPDWSLNSNTIEIDSITRNFDYFIPENLKEEPSLLFVLHGSNSNTSETRNFTSYEFEKIANTQQNFIIVYPTGYENHWNDCRVNASYTANKKNIDDLSFFKEMIDYFESTYKINSEKVFATGISNGGHMCYKLAYELPDKIKGIAPYVASIPIDKLSDCTPTNVSVPVIIINGTKDPINPYKGGWVITGKDSSRGIVHSTEETINYWKRLLPCNPKLTFEQYENIVTEDNSVVEHYKYACRKSKNKVELLKVVNGGHSVPLTNAPNLTERWKRILGNTNNDINSPQIVIDFFESISK